MQNSPLESSCVVVALTENFSISKPLNVSPEKSQILSFDTVVANERYDVKGPCIIFLHLPVLGCRDFYYRRGVKVHLLVSVHLYGSTF